MATDLLPDYPTRAAWWRNRAAAVHDPDLRVAYVQVARSYEQLAGQSQLCRLMVEREARQSGHPVPCCCPEHAGVAD